MELINFYVSLWKSVTNNILTSSSWRKHIKHFKHNPRLQQKVKEPWVCDISDTGFSNTCLSVHQRNLGAEDRKPLQIPSRTGRLRAKSESSCSGPGRTRGFCGQQLAPRWPFSASKSFSAPTAVFPLTHSSFLSASSGVPATWSRVAVGSCPWSCGQLSMSPLVAANAPQASLMLPTPTSPKAEKTRTLGEAEAVSWEWGGGVSKPLLNIIYSWQICLPL